MEKKFVVKIPDSTLEEIKRYNELYSTNYRREIDIHIRRIAQKEARVWVKENHDELISGVKSYLNASAVERVAKAATNYVLKYGLR